MSAIKLYPFQARGLDEGRARYREGARAVLFVGPTGMGKTTLAAEAAVGRIARGGRVVAFAHRRELVDQMAARLAAMGLDVGVAGRNASAPVQVMSVQSALARREIPDADFGIFDEAHHYVSDEWIVVPRTMLERGARLMGLTATPVRDDGRGLGGVDGVFDALVVVAQTLELVALNASEPDKGITPIEVLEPTESVRSGEIATAPVDAYLRHASGRSCVVFSPNVKTAHVFAAGFKRAGIEAPVVIGDPKHGDRSSDLERFARGDVRVIVNVAVLTEGWDAPICDVCMLARKIGSLSLFNQCVGRARRARHGKTGALLIDLAGNVALHGHPDEELDYSLEGAGVSRRGDGTIGPRVCRKCRRVLDEDLARAREAGVELDRCPECKTPISKIRIPTPQEIELARVTRDAARARLPEDKRTRCLVSLYAKGIRAGHKKASAEFAYRSMFKHFPPAEIKAPAWEQALAIVASERGDAWEHSDDRSTEEGTGT